MKSVTRPCAALISSLLAWEAQGLIAMFGIRHPTLRSLVRKGPFEKCTSHQQHCRNSSSNTAATAAETAVDVALGLAQAGCLAYLVFNNFLSTSVGDVVLVEKLSHKLQDALKPGDIVTCISPEDPRQSICKRLAALEGMYVAVPLQDPDVHPHALGTQQYAVHQVPRGHVWLLGDNTQLSHDCRSYGPVPVALLTGRVCAQVWPPNRARVFPPSQPQNPRQYAFDLSVSSCR